MGQREKHVCLTLMVVIQLTIGISDSVENVKQTDVLQDIHELRKEVEQLRSEVRQEDERLFQGNEKVVLDWLKEAVGDLRKEVRSLEVKETGHTEVSYNNELLSLKRDISDVKQDVLKLRVDEEQSKSRLEELEGNIKHVIKEEDMALREVMKLKEAVSGTQENEEYVI